MSRLLIVAFAPSELEMGGGFAKALGMSHDALLLTGTPSGGFGAEKVMIAALGEVPTADGLAPEIAKLAGQYTHVAAMTSMQAKDVLARLAGLMDAAMVTDVVAVDSPMQFKRTMVAGSVVATVSVLSNPVVLTFRPAGFAKPGSGGLTSEPVQIAANSKAVRISKTAGGGSRPDLAQAKTVVSGGRPLKDAETFETVIGGLADALGGAVGATRAAVDSGIAPNELQVGQTGKIVAPDLYIAAGISGSTQHMAGIKDSKVIVAINKDPDAPIFEFADFGLVADLFEAIPEIRAKIGK